MEEKFCVRCHESKPRSQYATSRARLCITCSNVPDGMSWCTDCRSFKPVAEFTKQSSSPTGCQPYCRACGNARKRDWYQRTPEAQGRRRERDRARQRHLDPETKAYQREYRKRNRERVRAQQAQWRADNRPRLRVIAQNARVRNRDGFEGVLEYEEWMEILDAADGACLGCERKIVDLTIDHVVPLIKGGTNTYDNVQPLCVRCNIKKGRYTDDEYDFRTDRVMRAVQAIQERKARAMAEGRGQGHRGDSTTARTVRRVGEEQEEVREPKRLHRRVPPRRHRRRTKAGR